MLMLIDDDDLQRLQTELQKAAGVWMPRATKDALNRAVEFAQRDIRKGLSRRMTLRNEWTAGSIQTREAYGRRIELQAAEVGSAAAYMRDQEEGAVLRATGKHGYPVPTGYAAGQMNKRPRTKRVMRPHRMAHIALRSHTTLGKNRKQRNVRSVQEAVRSGNRFVFLDYPRRKGIFKIVGGKKGTKRGWPVGAYLRLVWEMSRRIRVVRPRPWLAPQVDETIKSLPFFYKLALAKQLAKHGMHMNM